MSQSGDVPFKVEYLWIYEFISVLDSVQNACRQWMSNSKSVK